MLIYVHRYTSREIDKYIDKYIYMGKLVGQTNKINVQGYLQDMLTERQRNIENTLATKYWLQKKLDYLVRLVDLSDY